MGEASQQSESGDSRATFWIAVLGGGVLALVVGLITSAFQTAGVVDMAMAHLLMAAAWVVAVIYIGLVGYVWFREYTFRFTLISVVIVSVVLGGFWFWMVRKRAEMDMANVVSVPSDVGLRFVYPDSPFLLLLNLSKSEVARDMKYTVLLWNLNLPERTNPLPIPVSSFDWIKPGKWGGPQNLFSTPLVEPLIHPGDHLFGCASVTCPACIRDRAYVVSIIWKRGGWFAEISDESDGKCFVPKVYTREGISAYVNELSLKIPEHSRIPIEKPDKP